MRRRPDLPIFSARMVLLSGIALCLGFLGCGPRSPEPRTLILITVDTLRADRLGVGGSALGLTPQLDALAAESHHFTTVYAPTAFTLPSISALMTGQYPEALGITSNRSALRATIPTVASRLQQQGWRTAAVVSNFVLRRNSGLAVGFDHYDDSLPEAEIVRGWPERIAATTTDAAIARLDDWPADSDARSFLWVHYQDPHGPYTPPAGYRERYLPAEQAAPGGDHTLPERTGRGGRGFLPSYQQIGAERGVAFYRAGYDGEVAYLDEQVGRLLAAVDARGMRPHTTVVFTADHGEALGERNYWFAHGEHLSDSLVRVPLMIRSPGVEPEVRHDIVSLVDLYPTLLGMTIGTPADVGGRNLMVPGGQRADSQPYLATLDGATQKRVGIVDGPHKLVLTQVGSHWEPELYQLPREGGERRISGADIERSLRDKLDRFRNGLHRAEPELRQKLSRDEQQQLRALGYLEKEPLPQDADREATATQGREPRDRAEPE